MYIIYIRQILIKIHIDVKLFKILYVLSDDVSPMSYKSSKVVDGNTGKGQSCVGWLKVN